MLINKLDFIEVGIDAKMTSRYVNMLNRRMTSLTKKIDVPIRSHRSGRTPSKNFDLEYALKMAREMEFSTNPNTETSEWKTLREVLDLIKINKMRRI